MSGRGLFITLEGGDGCGKTEQTRRLAERLRRDQVRCLATREPGGTPIGDALRDQLMRGAFAGLGPEVETLIFAYARFAHVKERIVPALMRGETVVCDRFLDSTRAYQGAGEGVDEALIGGLEKGLLCGSMPDVTLILDLEPAEGLKRSNALLSAVPDSADVYETKRDLAFHERVHQRFRRIAATEPERCHLIDARAAPEAVEQAIWSALEPRLATIRSSAKPSNA